MNGPDAGLARERYRRLAPRYDRLARMSRRLRERAVDRLRLRRGETVFDVACGTGLSFALLEDRVGPEGRIIGLDLSAEMLSEAEDRVRRHAWKNVELVAGDVADMQVPGEADACLFFLTHDVVRSPRAIENVIGHVKPGGRVVAAGAKLAPWWALPVNAYVWLVARRYVTTFEGIKRPWGNLVALVPDLRVESVLLGGAYVASGSVPGRAGDLRRD